MLWILSSRSEQGARPDQQDRLCVLDAETPWGQRAVVAVFDGMGGIAHGGEASQAAADALLEAVASEDPLAALHEAVLPTGGGTTAAIAVLGETVHIYTVGDSGAYLLRDGRLELLAPKDATGPTSLTDFLGHPRCRGHVRDLKTRDGDAILLCTDGVDAVLDLEAMQDTLRGGGLHGLFEAVEAAGMPDNATAVLARR